MCIRDRPTPGQSPPNGKSPSDKKLNVLIGGGAVFLDKALGVLGWGLGKGGDGGAELGTAPEDEEAQGHDRAAQEAKGNDKAAAARGAEAVGTVNPAKPKI